jgi:hypothetical protein
MVHCNYIVATNAMKMISDLLMILARITLQYLGVGASTMTADGGAW